MPPSEMAAGVAAWSLSARANLCIIPVGGARTAPDDDGCCGTGGQSDADDWRMKVRSKKKMTEMRQSCATIKSHRQRGGRDSALDVDSRSSFASRRRPLTSLSR